MSNENENTAAGWTLMNTSVTRTTSYGYSNTCTLAQAMENRTYTQLTNLARCFGSLGMAIGVVQQTAKRYASLGRAIAVAQVAQVAKSTGRRAVRSRR